MDVIPEITTTRLIGVEMEYDACSTEYKAPNLRGVQGWISMSDGSLRNGREYVMEPPLPADQAAESVRQFCVAAKDARTNIGVRGGFHVHVQAHDITHNQCCDVALFYRKYQKVINSLLPESRRNNRWARNLDVGTVGQLVERYRLNQPAQNRREAKSSRHYDVVNLAMCRCTRPVDRSIEFRQGAPTKRASNIIGWAFLMTAMVDIVALRMPWNEGRASHNRFIDLIADFERRSGSQGIAQWVDARKAWVNAKVNPELIDRVCNCMGGGRHGIFHVSRALDINLGLAKRAIAEAVRLGKLSPAGENYYRAPYESWIDYDLRELEEAALTPPSS